MTREDRSSAGARNDADESIDDPSTDEVGNPIDDPPTDDVDTPTGESVVRPHEPDAKNERFLLDVMLGSLTSYLRMCGHDAAYALDRGVEADDRLVRIAADENRTLLTRDRELADRTPGGVLLVSRDTEGQLRELHEHGVELTLSVRPARCGNCNGRLVETSPDDRPAHAPDDRRLWRCRDCASRFWKGSHWNRVAETLAAVRH